MAELALGSTLVRKRKSYTREEKLKTVNYYYNNAKNLTRCARSSCKKRRPFSAGYKLKRRFETVRRGAWV